MEFIDTHCHIADPVYDADRDEVIARSLAAGVSTMLLADVDSGEREAMFKLAASRPDCFRPMLGLYPGSVREDWQEELDKLAPWTEGHGIVAIGEIGLDYHYGTEYKSQQKDALKAQLEMAARLDLPVNIHLREATEDFFTVLESCRGLGLRGNLHAFSGSRQTFERIARMGDWYVGIGGVLTFKKASIAEEIKYIPLERILLETDAPYLSPTPYRGERNNSSRIPVIAQFLAGVKGVSLGQVAETTTANARKLFNI